MKVTFTHNRQILI